MMYQVRYPKKLMMETAHMEVKAILKRLLARYAGVRSCQILDSEIYNELREILDLFYDREKNKLGRWTAKISTKN